MATMVGKSGIIDGYEVIYSVWKNNRFGKIGQKGKIKNAIAQRLIIKFGSHLFGKGYVNIYINGFDADNFDLLKTPLVSKKLQKQANQNKAVYYYRDVINNIKKAETFRSKCLTDIIAFSKIFSYNKNDCERYGFVYLPFACYQERRRPVSAMPEHVFSLLQRITGLEKYRVDMTYELLKEANKQNIAFAHSSIVDKNFGADKKVDYIIDNNNIHNDDNFDFNSDFAFRVGNNNCVVVFTQFGEDYLSSGVFEAFLYGRKIITNAKSVQDLPCYNAKFVKIVDSEKDITPELLKWAAKIEKVKYQNTGCLSLTSFIRRINENL
jgi:hypothetical protein